MSGAQRELTKAKQEKVMTQEQFNQIVEAIVDGKYSWACVLILRFADFNPLHYIPYRTYKRLLKENGRNAKKRVHDSIAELPDRTPKELMPDSPSSNSLDQSSELPVLKV
jgi:hypothetical protein